MTWMDDTISEFGRSMGLTNLAFDQEGLICLDFESLGTLFLEKADEYMLIYLAREVPPHETGILGRALALCHFRHNLPFAVNTAFGADDRLFFLVRLVENDVSLPILEKSIDLLSQLHSRVREEGY
jgi:type III secretion system chaperone SycN